MVSDPQKIKQQAIDEILALYFPNLCREWLEKINDRLGLFKMLNGGNVEMTTRFRRGHDDWTDWNMRDLTRPEQSKMPGQIVQRKNN